MIALARKTLAYEWRRFVPSVFAVGFAGVLLVMQAALVLGIFSTAAIYVSATSADLWVGYPGTQSVNFGRNIGPTWRCACAWIPTSRSSSPTNGWMATGARAAPAPRRWAECRFTSRAYPPQGMR
ncbi:hypothetical protein [Diaphorobacter aerolatus]|uniref:hypothetical protein n=1 Tax=Diaphorobacter aerolatus TaxID=1288495 RepID=UPI00299F5D18|nr:hypothetical protein [Diaphorobacter aerolatus]